LNIAVIPARGGSKRIPGKNIQDFEGKPLIAWSIEAALKSGLFEHVYISTDDEAIAETAVEYKAEVPFVRPPELSDDFTGTFDVVRHCINWCEQEGIYADNYCCIYATAPFITPDVLKEGFNILVKSGKSFAFSVTKYDFPVQRALRITEEGDVQSIWPENNMTRSQDLEETFHDAGQFYWGRKSAFLDNETLFSERSAPVLLSRSSVQDIDTPEDLEKARLMFKIFHQSEKKLK
jgi:pseudaminic acid cytidylyltransferase